MEQLKIFARDKKNYLDPYELEKLMQCPENIRVIDARDDDRVGGNVTGSIHVPDKIRPSEREIILWKVLIGATEYLTNNPSVSEYNIVTHCMESLRRGPRVAMLMKKMLKDTGDVGMNQRIRIRVLFGGADTWIRKHYRNSKLVENFDDEYWWFEQTLGSNKPDLVTSVSRSTPFPPFPPFHVSEYEICIKG